VGGTGTAAQYWNGDVCEVVVLTDEYPPGQLYAFEQALAAKWGVIQNQGVQPSAR
jgi:hypothetical protein